jgi:hypothetical protein
MADNVNTITYEFNIEKDVIKVISFVTSPPISTADLINKSNIVVCSQIPLPRSLLLPRNKNIKENELEDGWYYSQWNEKIHGKAF